MNRKLISIVLPIYNEEKNIPMLHQELHKTISRLSKNYDFEFIMVNDGSTDSSLEILLDLAQKEKHIQVINFSRNFGHQAALMAGYQYASGSAIITMDSDLQHPPHVIPAMLEAWEHGNYIVYIKNTLRSDRFLKKILSQCYYKFLDKISDIPVPHNVADFRLIDRKVLEVLHTTKEKSLYLRGIVAWTGLPYTVISTSFAKRKHGKAVYTWKKMFKLAFDGIASFSLLPLKLAAYVGFFVILTGTLMLTFITGEALFFNAYYPLFKWLVTIIYIFIGVLFILIWFLGEYIGRIYEELKDRPLFVVKNIYNAQNQKINQNRSSREYNYKQKELQNN